MWRLDNYRSPPLFLTMIIFYLFTDKYIFADQNKGLLLFENLNSSDIVQYLTLNNRKFKKPLRILLHANTPSRIIWDVRGIRENTLSVIAIKCARVFSRRP